MTDLIDRQAAIDEMRTRQHSANEWYATAKSKDDEEIMVWADSAIASFIECVLTLKKLPSVDAVEVVRCKDCKYFDSGTDEDGKLFFKCLGWVYGGTSEDDFCSHGERKDG